MNRRDALSRVAFLVGGTVVGAEAFMSGCSRKVETVESPMHFDGDQVSFLNDVGETILPATPSSPGAKAANVGEFMNTIVTDCYTPEEQSTITEGIHQLNELARKQYGSDFTSLEKSDQHDLLVDVDKEAKAFVKEEKGQPHYFTMMKQLTLWGYFTSEVGSKQALRYNPVPGKYEGCIPYKKGDKAWSAI